MSCASSLRDVLSWTSSKHAGASRNGTWVEVYGWNNTATWLKTHGHVQHIAAHGLSSSYAMSLGTCPIHGKSCLPTSGLLTAGADCCVSMRATGARPVRCHRQGSKERSSRCRIRTSQASCAPTVAYLFCDIVQACPSCCCVVLQHVGAGPQACDEAARRWARTSTCCWSLPVTKGFVRHCWGSRARHALVALGAGSAGAGRSTLGSVCGEKSLPVFASSLSKWDFRVFRREVHPTPLATLPAGIQLHLHFSCAGHAVMRTWGGVLPSVVSREAA